MPKSRKNRVIDQTEPFIRERYGYAMGDELMDKIWTRYEELCRLNKNDSKAIRRHTHSNIYPGIAMFETLLDMEDTRQDAADFIVYCFRQRADEMGDRIRLLLKIPGLYRKVPAIFAFGTRKFFGTNAGFEHHFYDTDKQQVKFDMIRCPYHDICEKYGCPEIVRAFCETDISCYGNMHPNLLWERTKTIGTGGDVCDFCITAQIPDKNKDPEEPEE